jgi:hypothetical protein
MKNFLNNLGGYAFIVFAVVLMSGLFLNQTAIAAPRVSVEVDEIYHVIEYRADIHSAMNFIKTKEQTWDCIPVNAILRLNAGQFQYKEAVVMNLKHSNYVSQKAGFRNLYRKDSGWRQNDDILKVPWDYIV